MFRFLPRLRREDRPHARPSPKRFQAEVATLEERALLSFIIKTIEVTPQVLWPPNGRFVPVHVSGTAAEFNPTNGKPVALAGPKIGQFHVTDEYRQNNPVGTFPVVHTSGNSFTFSFTVNLQATRATEFPQGRRYYVSIGLLDANGWSGSKSPKNPKHPANSAVVAVWVPKSLPPGFASTHTAMLKSGG